MREMSRTAVIADLSPDSAARTEKLLAEAGVRAVSRVTDGRRAMMEVMSLRPDVVVADAVLPAIDGMGLARRILSARLSIRPALIVAVYRGMIGSPRPEECCIRLIGKPIAAPELRGALESTRVECRPMTDRAKGCFEEILGRLGVPMHPGREYLADAAYLAYHDARLTSGLTKSLYPMVADRFSVTASAVERAMRHAIECAWANGSIEEQYGIFKGTIDAARGKPTCGGMIAQLAEMLRMEDGR